jgi:hypothetical protein
MEARRSRHDDERGDGMTQREWLESSRRGIRNQARLGLIAVFLGLSLPSLGHADEQWSDWRRFGLEESSDGNPASSRAGEQVVAALTPGSVLTAQVAGAPSEKEGWQFSVAPYLWAFRTTMSLDVGQLHRSTTIDFVDAVPQLHFAFAAHAEATWRKWTGFLDLFYVSLGQSETQDRVSVSTNLQELFFEFGAMYRFGPVSLGQAGKLSFEPLVGGRFMWLDTSLGFPNQKVSDSASVIDPMVGGRITYRITETVALWFRGDVAGFGISTTSRNSRTTSSGAWNGASCPAPPRWSAGAT